MTRTHGWCASGRRLIDQVPHGHWKTLTLIAALRHDDITARTNELASWYA